MEDDIRGWYIYDVNDEERPICFLRRGRPYWAFIAGNEPINVGWPTKEAALSACGSISRRMVIPADEAFMVVLEARARLALGELS